MNTKLTQADFDVAASAWATFIGSASPEKVQALFQDIAGQTPQYQTYVSFDLAASIPQLLSTVGINQVMARFVLAPELTPRFRVVLYAADALGGRISAYYQGDTTYHPIPPKPTSPASSPDLATPQGLVPFSLISTWLTNWVIAATTQQLGPAQFATKYGPLQGYTFELGDFMDQLFSAPQRQATQLYLNFGLKSYFPAYPEALQAPVQSFALVVRLFSPSTDSDSASDGTESGPSYDLALQVPPG